VRNSSLVERDCAENGTGLKSGTEAGDIPRGIVVEERSAGGEGKSARLVGACRSENAGMSSEQSGENPDRRRSKGSDGRSVRVGLVGPKPRPEGVGDGQLVNIPVPMYRSRDRGLWEDSATEWMVVTRG